jgi:hypothetical protein
MFGARRDKLYTLDLTYAGRKVGKIENLAESVSIQEIHQLVRAQCKLGDEYAIRLLLKGGRELPTEGGMVLGDITTVKPGVTRLQVIASVREKRVEPVDPEGDALFDAMEKQIVAAEERFAEGRWREGDERKKELLWFNSVVEVMTRLDALKMSHKAEYDRNERGRGLIRRCSVLLDKVEKAKE